MATKVQCDKKGEKIGTYWTNINKKIKPRYLIYQLKIPGMNPPKFEKDSKRMAIIAQKAHEDLLTSGLHPNKDEREITLQSILQGIREEDKLGKLAKETLDKSIDEGLTELALKESANGSAAGINGIPSQDETK